MQVITDAPTLLRELGEYTHNPSIDNELAGKLKGMPSNDVDRIFMALELLHTFRDRIGDAGLTLLGQLAAFSELQKWQVSAKPDRIKNLLASVKRDLGEPGEHPLVEEDPEPVLAYREDGKDYREDVEPDLDAMKLRKRKSVEKLKIEHQDRTAPTPFGVANSDMDSRGKINGLVTMALIAKSMNAPFEQGFTLADDSTVMLDANETIGLGVAVGTFVSAVHIRARALKDAIAAAVTVEELESIDITTDWP